MHLALRLLTILSLGLSLCNGSPTPHRHVVHEARSSIPTGWLPVRRAHPDIVLPLRVGLMQPNIHKVEEYLMEVSHPQSPGYGKHWTPAKVGQTFRPSEEAIDTVRSWLLTSGFGADRIRISNSGTWIRADVTVKEAEDLLGTEYYVYHGEDGTSEVIACADKYHLPEHVSAHVELVTPTLQFGFGRKRSGLEKRTSSLASRRWGSTPSYDPSFMSMPEVKVNGPLSDATAQLAACGEMMTPDCLRQLYNFTDYEPQAPTNNTLAIVEFTPNAYRGSDLDMFFANFSPSQVGQRPILVSIDGGVVQTTNESFDDNVESDLDLEFAMALVGPQQNVTLFQTGDLEEGGSPDDVLDALDASYCTYEGGDSSTFDPTYPDPAGYDGHDCGTVPLPSVLSFSYASSEAYFTTSYLTRMCNEFAKLGMMGVSVLWSTGDDGVGAEGYCLNSSGEFGMGTDFPIFNPSFPATCPYVTSVGATQINISATRIETAGYVPSKLSSGGGFSNVFTPPSYQQSAVEGYLTNYTPPYSSSIYNASGRGFPDLSANGVRYSVAVDDVWLPVYGTSASTPVIAAFLSAINDARIAAGKSTIGFINPTIYSSSFQAAFNDITDGSNPGCDTEGFNAEPGWDPVTGVGTPNVAMLRELWLQLS